MIHLLAAAVVLAWTPFDDDALLTVAERSDWTATATHAEVVSLLDEIAARSDVARRDQLGRSVENRELPLLILSDPPVASAAEAGASGKPIVFALGNIHAGEVCGKEALLMLARELALDAEHPLLDELVIVLAPIYNADGNERMSPTNRPGQVGPEQGMGERPNAQGFDLNRDHIKLESPEARAQVAFLTAWDPHLIIDTHTTNGSEHGFVLTYAAPLNPSGYKPSIEYLRDRVLPEVSARLEARAGFRTFFYGNFDAKKTVWATYSCQPRFGGPYRGLRGQLSILSEAYAYAPYRDRVLATLEFVREVLMYAAEHGDVILRLHDRARQETTRAGHDLAPDDVVGIRHRLAAMNATAIIPGRVTAADPDPASHTVVHLGRFEPVRSVRRPFAYIIEPGNEAAVETLRLHGIQVEPFEGDATAEVYTVTGIDLAPDPFQGHRTVRLEADARLETRQFGAGSTLVRTAQPLGNLVVYLLEPESQDGLATWNFFDDHLAVGSAFPAARVRTPEDLDRR